MLTDEVTGPIAVRLRCDVDAEGQFVIDLEENTVCPKCDMEVIETNGKEVENNAVCPKCDMDADEKTDKEIEIGNDAVRPNCDIDAEETTDNTIEENAVRPSDMDAEAFDKVAENKHENENGAAAAKKILEANEEVLKKDEEIGRIIEERRNTSEGEQQRLKDLSKQIRKCIRDKKKNKKKDKK